jgi:hypothetical protein
LVRALESSTDPAAADSIAALRTNHRCRDTQKTAAKLITLGRYHTPAAAVDYHDHCTPRIQDSTPPIGATSYTNNTNNNPTITHAPPSTTGTIIADDTYNQVRADRSKIIAERRRKRAKRRLGERGSDEGQ